MTARALAFRWRRRAYVPRVRFGLICRRMDFDDRLRQAIDRGHKRSELLAREAAAKAWTEEEFRRRHSQVRLTLSEHIESCLKRLPNYFPGFQYETMYGDRGWGV